MNDSTGFNKKIDSITEFTISIQEKTTRAMNILTKIKNEGLTSRDISLLTAELFLMQDPIDNALLKLSTIKVFQDNPQ